MLWMVLELGLEVWIMVGGCVGFGLWSGYFLLFMSLWLVRLGLSWRLDRFFVNSLGIV